MGTLIPDFGDDVRCALRKLYKPHFNVKQIAAARDFAHGSGDPNWRTAEAADELISELLAAAYPLKVKLHRYQNLSLKKGDLKAEYTDLQKTLQASSTKLRSVSAELDQLLDSDADPLGVAESVDALLAIIERASPRVTMAHDRKTDRVFDNQVGLRLIAALTPVCLAHGLRTAASAQEGRQPSKFVKATKLIANAMGLALAEKTWVNIASQARGRKQGAD